MNEDDLEKKVYQIVANSSGINANTIARKLHAKKKTINSLLYKNWDKFSKDGSNMWHVWDAESRSTQAVKAETSEAQMESPKTEEQTELAAWVRQQVEELRKKLLDLTRRNPLISARLSDRSNSILRVVDELPDVLFSKISEGQMEIIPLPGLEEETADEKTHEFLSVFANARLTDTEYIGDIEAIDQDDGDAPNMLEVANRNLKDRIRIQMGLAPRQTREDLSIPQHARNNNISPFYDLPDQAEGEKHTDDKIQTLMLPEVMETRMSKLLSKHRTWEQETGIHVMQAAFGFIEWQPPDDAKSNLAPLVMLPVDIVRTQTTKGYKFSIQNRGEHPMLNVAIQKKLNEDLGVELPEFSVGANIDEYMAEVRRGFSDRKDLKVKRQIAFGVFPSARIAMYMDLDTSTWEFGDCEIVNKLLGGSDEADVVAPFADDYDVDDPLIEAKVPLLVSDADASQFSVLADAAEGKNLAVEGPPGTGKSQTIVNTIAASLADGKKVLFVAEKTAALEVVKSRLEACGIGEFVMPLQAARSTKAEVMESIRRRVEMSRPSRPENLDYMIAQFREKRDRLQEYLDIISSNYGSSGYTVHQVLGQAMTTRVDFEQLHSDLRNRAHTKIAGIKRQEVDNLVETCRGIERAWEEASNSSPHWSGVKSEAVSPPVADIILSLSADTSNKYTDLGQSRIKLSELWLAPETSVENLRELIACLESASSLATEYDGALIRKIIESDHLGVLEGFLEKAAETREANDWLGQYIFDIWVEGLAEKVVDARETLNTCDLQSLCPDELGIKLLDLNQEISTLKNSSDIFAQIENIINDSGKIPSNLLVKCCDIVAKYPREVFEMRHDTYEDYTTRQIIREGSKKAEELSREGQALSEAFDTVALPGREEVGGFATMISEAGFFSFLSSEYRRAKKQFLLITKRSKYDKLTAAKDLKRLHSWMNDISEYKQDHNLKTLLGVAFNGVDSDFTHYLNSCSFYEEVNDVFRGENNAESYIRDCLKRLPVNAIVGLPEIPQEHAARNVAITPEQTKNALSEKGHARENIKEGIDSIPIYAGVFRETGLITATLLDQFEEMIPRVQRDWRELEDNQEMRSLLGELFQGANTSKERIARSLQFSSYILELEEPCRIPCAKMLESNQPDQISKYSSFMEEVVKHSETAEEYLVKLSEESGIKTDEIQLRAGNQGIISFLNDAAQDRKGLRANASLAAGIEILEGKGFRFILDSIVSDSIPINKLTTTTQAWVYQKMAANVYESAPNLGEFTGTNLDNLRQKIATLDLQIIKSSRKSLAAELHAEASPPSGIGRGRRSTWTDMNLITHQLSLKRVSAAPRDLIKRSSKALLELKPCWMMSPLAVAQYIPKGTIEFDLIIVDEASQMSPQNAIGALARGKQAMVVGDTNQLPPSSFFQRTFSDDEEDEDVMLEESILELANSTFRPKRRLKWHYRSRNSALIAFSNRHIYDDSLTIFPSPNEADSSSGVSLEKIKGLYSSGTNPIEAQKIVEAIKKFMVTEMNKPKEERRSLAVVLMNKKQTELIEDLFNHVNLESPAVSKYVQFWKKHNDGLEEFIVKNLENIQGDERDVIFIGTVYGPEQEGSPVMQRFGPINGVAGKRRLNVLFTRAKHKIVTFSSMTAADITANQTTNPGSNLLKLWLEYSETGRLDAGEVTKRGPDSEFEEFVIEQVEAMGCEAVPQVGVKGFFIDIGVRHPLWPHGFLLGVECDGATYHSSKCARDRDRLRQSVLEGLGWKIHRIWSTDWFSDPRTEAGKLREVIEEALAEKRAASIAEPDVQSEEGQPSDELESKESEDSEENEENNLAATTSQYHPTFEERKPGTDKIPECPSCGLASAYIDINNDGMLECSQCEITFSYH